MQGITTVSLPVNIMSTIKNKKRKILEGGPEGAKRAAISLLAYREQTEKELLSKLMEKGFSREDAEEAVAFTVEKQYLSERRYYLRFAEFCGKNKHFGRRRIIQEARRKGFSERTIAAYTDEALQDVDFGESCYEALCQFRHKDRQKLTASLLRRGFSTSDVRHALDRYTEEQGAFEEGEDFFEDDSPYDGDFADE